MTLFQLLLDIGVIGLLCASIYYAVRLERQLAILREARADMQRSLQEFALNIGRAEAGVKNMKLAARESGDDLEALMERSRAMHDELQFMVDRADSMVEKLGQSAPRAAIEEAAATPRRDAKDEPSSVPSPRSRAEKELLQALQKKMRGKAS